MGSEKTQDRHTYVGSVKGLEVVALQVQNSHPSTQELGPGPERLPSRAEAAQPRVADPTQPFCVECSGAMDHGIARHLVTGAGHRRVVVL